MVKDLDYYLQEISVMDITIDSPTGKHCPSLIGWFAVVNEDGIIAYFGEEKYAFKFRLDYINNKLNG